MELTSSVSSWLMGLLTIYIGAYLYAKRKLHPQEPPVVASPIPVVGHVLFMVLLGSQYIKNLGLRHRSLRIFTLPVPGSRLYIVTSPSLAAQVQRASRALSFMPLIPDITERVFGLDANTMKIVRRGLDPAPGEKMGFLADIQELVYSQLASVGDGGGYLEELTLAAVGELRREVAGLSEEVKRKNREGSECDEGERSGLDLDLLEWLQTIVASGTAKYLYGPENPFAADPGLVQAFWEFDHGLAGLLLGLWPSVTAKKACKARERLCAGFVEYLETGKHLKNMHTDEGCGPSKIIQKRVELALRHGWTLEMIARSELSFLFAGIVNATTATFWIVLRLFADRELLKTVRSEIESALTLIQDFDTAPPSANGNEKATASAVQLTLSIRTLRDKCPLLVAVYRECLRLGSDNASTRLVKEDILLADQYFLRAGSVVQIAGGTIHADHTIWGEDVDEFNPRRFLSIGTSVATKTTTAATAGIEATNTGEGGIEVATQQKHKHHPAAFRAFGGGKTICPGRHFAMNEILTLVALIVLQFDMSAADVEEGIRVPRKNDGVMPVHILEPVEEVRLRVRLRDRKLDSQKEKEKWLSGCVGGDENWSDVLSGVRFSMGKT